MKHIRKSLLVLCVAALLASLLGAGTRAATQEFVSYVDENGETQRRLCTIITGGYGSWRYTGDGWYAVKEDVWVQNGLICSTASGDFNLILCDGATLTVGTCFDGSDVAGTVNIYGQEKGTGKLIAGSEAFDAYAIDVNDLTVRGGVLQATSSGGYGIYASKNVAVSGGRLSVRGTSGIEACNGSITVSGGSVTATGASGIEARKGSITVSGGTVEATATEHNALCAATGITVTGGEVIAVQTEGHDSDYNAVFAGSDQLITLDWNAPDAGVLFESVGNDVDIKTRFTVDDDATQSAALVSADTFNSSYANKALRPYVEKYDVSLAETTNGTVAATVNGAAVTQTYENAKVTLTLTPEDGYKAAAPVVMQGETPVEVTRVDATHYTFTMPAGDVTVTAAFEAIPTYSVIVAGSDEHGTVTANLTQAKAGETVTLTLTPADGCRLATLTVRQGEEDVAVTEVDATHRTFTMPEGDVTVTAAFITIPSHDVIISAHTAQMETGGATVTASPTRAVEGAKVTLTLGLEDNDHIYSTSSLTVKQGEKDVSVTRVDATHYTFTMPTGDEDVTVTAEFWISDYIIRQGNETGGAKLTYNVYVFNETASLTVVDAWGNFDVVIPDTVPYNTNNWPVTTLSVSSDALSGIATLTGGANVRTISGNLYDWQKETTRNFNSEGYYSLSGLDSVAVPDTTAALAAIPAFISGHYENGAYYVGKCLVRVDPNHSGNFAVKDGTICVLAGAFEGCTKLGAVTLPDSVEFIGMRAFANSSVTSVNLPTGLIGHSNVIYTQTFYNCRSLTTVSFGTGVTLREVGYCAFTDCVKLTDFDFTKIGAGALNMLCFAGAFDPTANVAISLSTGQFCSSSEGPPSVFAKSGVKSVTFLASTGAPYVPPCCFYDCKQLDTLTLSSSGMQLRASCFEACTKLTADVLAQTDNGVYYLDYRCFANTGMTAVTIPARVSYYAGGVFADNPQLVTLNWYASYTDAPLFAMLNDCSRDCIRDDEGVFLNVYNLTGPAEADFSSSDYALKPEKDGHTFITTLNLYAALADSMSSKFYLQPYLETVNIHNAADATISVPSYMFMFCPSLSTVSFDHPEKVASIGEHAFAYCPGLHSFPFTQMTGLTAISTYAFMLGSPTGMSDNGYSAAEIAAWPENDARRGRGLTGTLDLSKCENLSSISSWAFEMQYSFSELNLPKNVGLGSTAVFLGCASLKTLEAACPTGYLNSFGANFGTTPSQTYSSGHINDVLETIVMTNAGGASNSFFQCLTGLKRVRLEKVGTNGENDCLPYYMFNECVNLETVELPDVDVLYGDSYGGVFNNCYKLKTLDAPQVKVVNGSALHCNGLKELSLPALQAIHRNGYLLFAKCPNLEKISFPELTEVGSYYFSNFSTDELPSLKEVYLPKVTTVSECAFQESKLTSVSLPEATTVGSFAFFRSALTSVSLPKATSVGDFAFAEANLDTVDLSSVTTLNMHVFNDNKATLTSVSLPCVTGLGAYAFCNAKLGSVSLPNATTLGTGAFAGATLESIDMPKVKTLGEYAFAGSSLDAIALSSDMTLGKGAFAGSALKTVSVPNMKLSPYLFADCDSLTSATIAEGTTALSWFLFADCDNLASVTLPSTLAEVSWAAFKDTPKLTELTVPASVTLIDDDAFAMYYAKRAGTLELTVLGTPEIKTSLTEDEIDEREYYLVSEPDEDDDEEFWVDYNAIVALLPIPDGSAVRCTETARPTFETYRTAFAPQLRLYGIDEVIAGLRGVSVKNGAVTATVSAPENALLIAASYDASGRLLDAATRAIPNGCESAAFTLTVKPGASYRLMLVNASTYAPLCGAVGVKA